MVAAPPNRPESPPVCWRTGFWWWLACVAAYSAAFPLGFALSESVAWGWSIGGLGIGLLQWLVLRRHFRRYTHPPTGPGSLWWIPLSLLGTFIGSGGSFFPGELIWREVGLLPAFAAAGGVIGLGVGLSQWVMLRRWVRQAGWWVAANLAAHALGVYLAHTLPSLLLTGRIIYGSPEFGLIIGIVVGAVTGPTLVLLLRKPTVDTAG